MVYLHTLNLLFHSKYKQINELTQENRALTSKFASHNKEKKKKEIIFQALVFTPYPFLYLQVFFSSIRF